MLSVNAVVLIEWLEWQSNERLGQINRDKHRGSTCICQYTDDWHFEHLKLSLKVLKICQRDHLHVVRIVAGMWQARWTPAIRFDWNSVWSQNWPTDTILRIAQTVCVSLARPVWITKFAKLQTSMTFVIISFFHVKFTGFQWKLSSALAADPNH